MIEVILPALDEAGRFPDVLAAVAPGFVPLVVDNGSLTDGSEVSPSARRAGRAPSPVAALGRPALLVCSPREPSSCCFMDCDGSLDPIVSFTGCGPRGQRHSEDLCLGARMPEPGVWPWHARIANRLLAFELRRTGAAVTDLGPMRAARREALLGLRLRDRRSGWPLEMVLGEPPPRAGASPRFQSPTGRGRKAARRSAAACSEPPAQSAT